ncbi:Hsp70 family protein, partial [Candidatus Bipolaricaulota bacterium]|nr:Hsp70 family protein [Candidatus Bipolaricaulota bacterium]
DVTPLTLSIETLGGVATPLIERNTTIPTEKAKTFTTAEDSQPSVEIHVLQGERKMAADSKSLGKFQLVGLPPSPRGIPQIDVTFNIDTDGILHVTAKDKATGKSSSITIKESSHLDDSEIDRMRREAETHAEEDDKKAKDVEARNQADQLVYSVEKSLSELGEKVSPEERGKIEDQLRSVRDKLSQDASADELRQAMEELSKQAQHLAEQAYKQAATESPETPSDQEQETDKEENGGDYVDAEYEEEK